MEGKKMISLHFHHAPRVSLQQQGDWQNLTGYYWKIPLASNASVTQSTAKHESF